ncbi:S8 family peptidase [Salipaludibacillus sp. LMS25]|jgi:serine protease AprX|uniref:S8 family peptidase n=1 Tax=Salipaludibacillus sp. LMS25 TaxID=2924031 RepID=UPI0020D09D21|nr:S8 family peptidase [Salipaludibacillus sp. LMS25]UTR13566.1 S8 family peptidase [Salipaludibacillus sp. LMS25]
MYGFSMVKAIREHAGKLDKPCREHVMAMYKPFRRTPCFLHKPLEALLKKITKISVIIQFEDDCFYEGCKEFDTIVKKNVRCQRKMTFSSISCCSATITPQALEELVSSCHSLKKIFLNRKVTALLDTAVEASNAQKIVREGHGVTGEGINIAIIDTGVYPHDDLEGRITAFVDLINNRTAPYDDNGHGTHCAGDAAGDGSASDGQYKGPAPRANIIGVKVLDKNGSGSLETIIEGVQWCIDYNETNTDNPIHILNMSLGTTAQQYENETDDPMVQIVNEAWQAGIVVVAAAGNSGPEPTTIASPGISRTILTVGALDDHNTPDRKDDEVADFSSRGPTIYGIEKPDILAPGVDIISLKAPNSILAKSQKENQKADYITLSGTSMAAPLCAGIIALMLEVNPDLTPDEVKERIKNGADLWNDREPSIYGAGYINGEESVPES